MATYPIDIVRKGMMLLVHHLFMGAVFETEDADKEQTQVVDPFRAKGVPVQELVLAGKGEALKLKAVEEIEGKKGQPVCHGRRRCVHSESADRQGRDGHDGQVNRQSLIAFVVGLFQQSNQHTVVEYAIALLSLAMLDIGPVLPGAHRHQTLGIGGSSRPLGNDHLAFRDERRLFFQQVIIIAGSGVWWHGVTISCCLRERNCVLVSGSIVLTRAKRCVSTPANQPTSAKSTRDITPSVVSCDILIVVLKPLCTRVHKSASECTLRGPGYVTKRRAADLRSHLSIHSFHFFSESSTILFLIQILPPKPSTDVNPA
jgi:hypothetical protein